ncbi:MAG: glycosyltransferase [Fibrobacter sp.]|nr:glycosyltransferase [Fibrobacter sp.]
MAFHLIRTMADSNSISVSAIIFNNGRLADELKNAGVDVTVFEESRYSFPVLVYKVFRKLRSKKIDLIHSHRQKENILALIVSVLLRNTGLVSTLHGMPENPSTKLTIHSIIRKLNFFLLSRFFSCTVAVSNDIRDILINRGFSKRKIITIHNGIPLPSFDTDSKKDTSRSFTIGTAGRLVPVKDFGLFIDIAFFLRNHQNIHFLLAGDGPLEQDLRCKVSELGLNNFSFSGKIDDMNLFYKQIDIFMNTSIHEGIPMTILEAMSRGIPVIAPCVGGLPEIIENGVDGFLIQKRNLMHYAGKSMLLSNDLAVYQIMAQAAQEKIKKRFSVSIMTQSYIGVYLEISGCSKSIIR